MRIGLFGGTFDPIHCGHVRIAEWVRDRLRLDRVWLMPSHRPPHKDRADLTPGADRLAMIALGTQGDGSLVPSSFELGLPGPCYTVETLGRLADARPSERFFFIMGMDSFQEFSLWKDYEILLRRHHLVVVNRPGTAQPAPGALPDGARERLVDGATDRDAPDGRVHMLNIEPQNVSATQVRDRARRGENLTGLVPEPVEDYIRKCALYRSR